MTVYNKKNAIYIKFCVFTLHTDVQENKDVRKDSLGLCYYGHSKRFLLQPNA